MRFLIGGPRLFGLRTGIMLSLKDLGFGSKPALADAGGMTGGFIYVVKGDHGHVKVGVSTDPVRRLGELQTGSPYRLWIDYAGALTDYGYGLEGEAHQALDRYRLAGEWFNCPTAVAVAAVSALAHKRGERIASVDPALIPQIIQIASAPPAAQKRHGWLGAVLWVFAVWVAVDVAILMFDPHYFDK